MMGRLATPPSHTDQLAWCCMRVTMSLLVFLLVLPFALLEVDDAQELDLLVLDTCVESEQSKEKISERNAYAREGCNLTFFCTYRKDYCASYYSTDLQVYPLRNDDRSKDTMTMIKESMRTIESNKCNVTVRLLSVTLDHEGLYRCRDRITTKWSDHRLEVGEPPVQPRNVRLVYEPTRRMYLEFDPVKSAKDLSDDTTRWIITYQWSRSEEEEFKSCPSNNDHDCDYRTDPNLCEEHRCLTLTRQNLCRPCVINFKDNDYSGCGQYTASEAFLTHPVRFRIVVNNRLGETSEAYKFDLSSQVKPGRIQNLKTTNTSSSWISMTATSPLKLDRGHYSEMNKTESPLILMWKVEVLRAREQSLQDKDSKEFNKTHGILRNLRDNEEALIAATDFDSSWKRQRWQLTKDRRCYQRLGQMDFSLTDLPYAGYTYRVSARPTAHYKGKKVSTLVSTMETAPLEGPQLYDSFAHCPVTGADDPCMACIIYFKEIPRCRRGGVVQKYTATLTLDSKHPTSPCSNRIQVGEAGSLDNSMRVGDLMKGGEYQVRLQAHTRAGSSPATIKTLLVNPKPSTVGPRDFVAERFNSSYNLHWKLGQSEGNSTHTYYVHFCYTLEETPLDCVTNLESRKVPASSLSFNWTDVIQHPGLGPAFFVSVHGGQEDASRLYPVKCFYADHEADSGSVRDLWVQRSEDNSQALVVTFYLPCGSDSTYTHSRPGFYHISVSEDDGTCADTCSSMDNALHIQTFPVNGGLYEKVVYTTEGDLKEDTSYCVRVAVSGHGEVRPDKGTWQCDAAMTGSPSYAVDVACGIIVFIVLLLIIFGLLYSRRRWVKLKHRFPGEGELITILPGPEPCKKIDHTYSLCSESNGDIQDSTKHFMLSLHAPVPPPEPVIVARVGSVQTGTGSFHDEGEGAPPYSQVARQGEENVSGSIKSDAFSQEQSSNSCHLSPQTVAQARAVRYHPLKRGEEDDSNEEDSSVGEDDSNVDGSEDTETRSSSSSASLLEGHQDLAVDCDSDEEEVGLEGCEQEQRLLSAPSTHVDSRGKWSALPPLPAQPPDQCELPLENILELASSSFPSDQQLLSRDEEMSEHEQRTPVLSQSLNMDMCNSQQLSPAPLEKVPPLGESLRSPEQESSHAQAFQNESTVPPDNILFTNPVNEINSPNVPKARRSVAVEGEIPLPDEPFQGSVPCVVQASEMPMMEQNGDQFFSGSETQGALSALPILEDDLQRQTADTTRTMLFETTPSTVVATPDSIDSKFSSQSASPDDSWLKTLLEASKGCPWEPMPPASAATQPQYAEPVNHLSDNLSSAESGFDSEGTVLVV